MNNNKKKNIVILGTTSAIAEEVCKLWAKEGHNLLLLGRNKDNLMAIQNNLKYRYNNEVVTIASDLSNTEDIKDIMVKIKSIFSKVDVLLIAYASLIDDEKCINDNNKLEHGLYNNSISQILWLNSFRPIFMQQKFGHIAVITSVAGDRVKPRNNAYGAAKHMLSGYLDGLRAKLFHYNVNVLDVKPGIILTPMAAKEAAASGLSNLHLLLAATPQNVALDIVKAINKKKYILYTPWFWKYIMLIIKYIPIFVFNRLKNL